jgi:hypothetical protein
MRTSRIAIALSIVAILSAVGLVYAASYTLSSGEFVGLGAAKGRLQFDDTTVDKIRTIDADFSIESATLLPRSLNFSLASGGSPLGSIQHDTRGKMIFTTSSGGSGKVGFDFVGGPIYVSTAVASRAYNSADQSISNATNVAVALNSENHDSDDIHDNSTNNTRLTAKTAGYYTVSGGITFASNSTGTRSVSIRKGGSTYIAAISQAASASGGTYIGVDTQFYLGANEYVELMAYQNSGGALNVLRISDHSPFFAMARVP